MDTWIIGHAERDGRTFLVAVQPYLDKDGWYFGIHQRPVASRKWRLVDSGYVDCYEAVEQACVLITGLILRDEVAQALEEYRQARIAQW